MTKQSFKSGIIQQVAIVGLLYFTMPFLAAATTETITTASTSPWTVPSDVFFVSVECWGGGGAGGGGSNTLGIGGAGGGGGAYAQSTVFVLPGETNSYAVGEGANGSTGNGADGYKTTFSSACGAAGGKGGLTNSAAIAAGGAASNSTGDVTYDGGDGYGGGSTVGGGGGSSAGSASNGTDASGQTGATAPAGGGNGGSGGNSGANGSPGSVPGGGGGGGGKRNGTSETGGSGADGQVKLTYATVSGGFVAGRLYSDIGRSTITDTRTIKLAVSTSSPASVWATTTSMGGFAFNLGSAVDDFTATTTLVLWVDGSSTTTAATVVRLSGPGDVFTASLYEGMLVVGNEGGAAVTVEDLDIYDSSQDDDIPYTASSTGRTLSLTDGTDLLVPFGGVFINAASSTLTGSLYNEGSFISGGTSVTLAGDDAWLIGSFTDDNFLGSTTITGTYTTQEDLAIENLFIAAEGTLSSKGYLTLFGSYLNSGTFNGTEGIFEVRKDDTEKIGGDGVSSSWSEGVFESAFELAAIGTTLYAGLGISTGDAEVWSYNGTSWTKIGGDAVNSSWADSTFEYVKSLTTIGTTLYAGLGTGTGDAEVWSYDGTSWTKIGGDGVNSSWADSTYEEVYALTAIGTTLYAGLGYNPGEAEVWSYNGTSWTKIGGDAVNSSWADSTYEEVYALITIGTTLYAGLGASTGDAEVWAYDGTSWTKIGGDAVNSSWDDSTFEFVESLAAIGTTLYAGLGSGNGEVEVWSFNGAVWTMVGGNDVNSSWSSGDYEYLESLTTIGTTLYAGLGEATGNAVVWSFKDNSWTKIAGDGINSTWPDDAYENVESLTAIGTTLYAGLGSDVEIWSIGVSDQTLSGTLTGTSTLGSLVFTGSATKTTASTASTTSVHIDTTSGEVVFSDELDLIGPGFSNEGSMSAPSLLRVTEVSDGVSKIGGDGVNSSWADSTFDFVESLTVIGTTLYAGLGVDTGEAEVWSYNGTSWTKIGGDAVNSSWADSTFDSVRSLTAIGTTLYAGLGVNAGEAEVWSYNGTSWTKIGGDAVNSSWADSTFDSVRSLTAIGTTLYAGLGVNAGEAEVWSYNGTSWTKIGGDAVNSSWADSTFEIVGSLTAIGTTLYAGLGTGTGEAEVWSYNGTSWTKIGGDAVNSSWADSTFEYVESLTAIGTTLYAGLGTGTGEAEVWSYNGTSWTKIGGDAVNSSWADGTFESVRSLTAIGTTLYAGLGTGTGDAEVWSYNGTSWTKIGGDADNSSWAGSTFESVGSLAAIGTTLYAGLGTTVGDAEVWIMDGFIGLERYLSGNMVGANAWQHLNFANEWGVIISDSASSSDFTVSSALASVAVSDHFSVAGDYANDGEVDFNGNLWFGGSSAQTISGTLIGSSSLPNVIFTGAGTKTFGDNASTSNITIDDTSGEVNFPNQLSILGVTFSNNNVMAAPGTLYVEQPLAEMIGGDRANSSWPNYSYEYVYTLTAIGTTLYAGLGSGFGDAEIWSYNGSSWTMIGGDGVNSSWAGGSFESVESLTVIGTTLYAGLGSGTGDAEVWSYNGTSWTKIGGDAVNSSWADSTYEEVYALTAIGTTLYAGLGYYTGNDEVWSYNGSSWTKIGGDGVNSSWADSTYEVVSSLTAIDTTLYAGVSGPYSGDAEVWSYNGTSWTKIGGDAVNSSWADSTFETVYSLVSIGTTLYAGLGYSTGDAEVWSYNGTSWTKIGGDAVDSSWAGSAYETVDSLTTIGTTLYAGLGSSAGDAEIWSYNGTSWTKVGGDVVSSSWADSTYETVDSLTTIGTTLYAGLGYGDGDAEVWSLGTAPGTVRVLSGNMVDTNAWQNVNFANEWGVIISDNASTSDFVVSSASTSVSLGTAAASTTKLSVAGDYENNGTFTANNGEVVFSGVTAQTATGTMTESSAFYDVTINNTSANGTSSRSVTFGAVASSTGTFTIGASSSVAFMAGATSTFNNIVWDGLSATSAPVWVYSSATGTAANLAVSGTATVYDAYIRDTNVCGSAGGGLIATSSVDVSNNFCWTFEFEETVVAGSSTIVDHDVGQVDDAFNFMDKTNEALFAFKLIPESGNATVTELSVSLSGAIKIDTSDFSNIRLLRDHDSDATYDGTDEEVGGAGVMVIDAETRSGSITFSTDFLATTSENYLIVADWNASENGAFIVLDLYPSGVSAVDDNGAQTIYGGVDQVQHSRDNHGSGSNRADTIGGAPPWGNATTTGGTPEGGEEIGDDPDFYWPTAHSGPWNNGAYAYDKIDGTYATTGTDGATSTLYNHNLPTFTDTIGGILVKLEVAAVDPGGTVDVDLSWDGGTTWSDTRTTPTLTGTDTVITLGGLSDTWGRASWSVADFSNSNFRVRLTGNTSANTIFVDAVQVKVYHYTSGGGAGGGDEID